MPSYLLTHLLLQIFVVGYTPGPANIYALAMSLRYGKKRSLTIWVGLLCGAIIAVCAMAVVAHFIGVGFAGYIHYMKYIGAAYILYLAYRIWHSGRKGASSADDCSFLKAMTVQLTNAKLLLFELSVFATFVLPYSNRFIDLLTICPWLLLAGPGANLVWLLAGNYLRSFFNCYQRQTAIVSAIALALCACYIIAS